MRGNLTPSEVLTQILSDGFAKRFWPKLEKRGPDECWPWLASLHNNGYGQIFIKKVKGETILEFSHRASWMLHNKVYPPEDKPCILHSCVGNRRCCNPNHLRAGTSKENTDEMIEQGRKWVGKGENAGKVKLKDENIFEIRRLYSLGNMTQKDISNVFCVDDSTICNIVKRKTWSHI